MRIVISLPVYTPIVSVGVFFSGIKLTLPCGHQGGNEAEFGTAMQVVISVLK
jgi:hypothetical protein